MRRNRLLAQVAPLSRSVAGQNPIWLQVFGRSPALRRRATSFEKCLLRISTPAPPDNTQ
jgi:hypothetical protein